MVVIEAETLGGYPRSTRLRKILRKLEEQGEEALAKFWSIFKEDTLIVVGAQLGAGLKIISDGLLDWHDLFRPFVNAWRGVYPSGLLRWFDNNFFYRIPVFVELPDPQSIVVAPRVKWLSEILPTYTSLKAILPGPYTFVKMSRNLTGEDELKLADYISSIIEKEVEKAITAGARVIQLEEPYLGYIDASPDEAKEYLTYINRILGKAKNMGASTRLTIQYSIPKEEVYSVLLDLKADYLVIDVADSPKKALSLISSKSTGDYSLGLGIIQARDIYLEEYEKVRNIVQDFIKTINSIDKLLLTTSAWLDLIPLEYAFEKTAILAEYARRLSKEF